MTSEDATHKFKQMVEVNEHYGNSELVELFNTAVDALEKQIPKNPIIEGDEMDCTWKCPVCKTDYSGYTEFKYCLECGQAISWV